MSRSTVLWGAMFLVQLPGAPAMPLFPRFHAPRRRPG